MTVREQAVLFGKTNSLVGIVTEPTGAKGSSPLPAFILLNSGRTHRVGPNRLYVRIARDLSAMGAVVLRFDASGIGDSFVVTPDGTGPAQDDARDSAPNLASEPQEAMNFLRATRAMERFVLLGICSGAAAALATARLDPRVLGAILIGAPPPRDPPALRTRVLARHFMRIAFSSSFSSKKWRKLIRFKFDYRRVVGTMSSLIVGTLFSREKDKSPSQSVIREFREQLQILLNRDVRLLVVHAEGDEGLDYTQMLLDPETREQAPRGQLDLQIIEGSNHLFTPRSKQDRLVEVVLAWTAELEKGARG